MRPQIQIFNASTSREVDAAFASFGRERPDALFVGQDGFFNSRRLQLANMAARYAVPMTSGSRDIAEVGGLMSYGGNITDAYRQMGVDPACDIRLTPVTLPPGRARLATRPSRTTVAITSMPTANVSQCPRRAPIRH